MRLRYYEREEDRSWFKPFTTRVEPLDRAALEVRGAPIGAMDLMIAAHARSLGATVVTRNVRHFSRVPGLAVENWA